MPNDELFELSEVVRRLLVHLRRNLQIAIDTNQLSLSVQEAHILILLNRSDLNTPMQLACHSGYDKSVITRIVKQLLENDYLEKKTVETDRRSVNLSLTMLGKELQNRLQRALLEAHQKVFGDLNKTELKQVTELLQKCI